MGGACRSLLCVVLGVPSSVWKVLCICGVCRVWREDALEGR